jgi:hypothetical protein
VGAVKGGRSPAKRTLDGDRRTLQSSLAECRHGAAFKARGYTRFATMRTVLFLIAGKLDFTPINPHAA